MNKYKIGNNSFIKANKIKIDDTVVIGDNVQIVCDEISIGFNSYIGNNIKINCKKFLHLQKSSAKVDRLVYSGEPCLMTILAEEF